MVMPACYRRVPNQASHLARVSARLTLRDEAHSRKYLLKEGEITGRKSIDSLAYAYDILSSN